MIKFDGVRFKNKLAFLIFSSDERTIDVPVDELVAKRVLQYIQKIEAPAPKNVELGNDGPSD